MQFDDISISVAEIGSRSTQRAVAHVRISDYVRDRSTGQIYIGKELSF